MTPITLPMRAALAAILLLPAIDASDADAAQRSYMQHCAWLKQEAMNAARQAANAPAGSATLLRARSDNYWKRYYACLREQG